MRLSRTRNPIQGTLPRTCRICCISSTFNGVRVALTVFSLSTLLLQDLIRERGASPTRCQCVLGLYFFLFFHTLRIERIQPILSVFVFNISIFPLPSRFTSLRPTNSRVSPFFTFFSVLIVSPLFPQPPSSLLFSPHFVCI